MTGPVRHFAVQALLHSAGIVSAFLLCATAAALFMAAGPSIVQPLMALLLAMASATLVHASGQMLTGALVMVLSALPFCAWLAHLAWYQSRPAALVTAIALPLAAVLGAFAGKRLVALHRWRAGHSATVLLTITAVLLIILAPLLLMMPR